MIIDRTASAVSALDAFATLTEAALHATDLGTYQKAHEARGACNVQSDRELKWVKRLDGVWEAELDGSLYRLVVTRDQ